jgi:hypothetical protein
LIRKKGKGVGLFILPKPPPGFRNAAEVANTRAFSNLFLSGLKRKGWWDWWLWDTWTGKAFQNWVDKFAASLSLANANFDGRDGARESFKLLKNEGKYVLPSF